jgi:alpha-1,2-mannosyltransferase
MATLPGTESVRFRYPTTGPNARVPKVPEPPKKDQFGSMAPQGWKRRHQGLLQDQVGRYVVHQLALYVRANIS